MHIPGTILRYTWIIIIEVLTLIKEMGNYLLFAVQYSRENIDMHFCPISHFSYNPTYSII